jgi:hypothetical protein
MPSSGKSEIASLDVTGCVTVGAGKTNSFPPNIPTNIALLLF